MTQNIVHGKATTKSNSDLSNAKVAIVIPSRMASTRLPEKPLALIKGKPMVQWVYEKACQVAKANSKVVKVFVATDHERICSEVKGFGGEAIMTPAELASGTDRVAYVAERNPDIDIWINFQGDEPMMRPATVLAALAMVQDGSFSIATAAAPIVNPTLLPNPNVVKVLVDKYKKAVYFSRFAIPYSRVDDFTGQGQALCLQHFGIYVYTRQELLNFTKLERSGWELKESLEQLRAMYHGIPIGVAQVEESSVGVDTKEDLEMVSKLI